MGGRSWRICRIAGIPVGISPWWLVIVVLLTWMLGADYYPEAVPGIAPLAAYGLGLASVLLLFASILAHEFGHAIVARRHGVQVEGIELWLLGGVSKLHGEAHSPGDELRYALAGPAVSAVVTACFAAIAVALPASAPAAVKALVDYELIINALIVAFNLIPAFPLDGGRVARALIWRRTGTIGQATAVAAAIGRGFGALLIAVGVLALFSAYAWDGLWLAMVGFFIFVASKQQAAGAEVRAVFGGASAAAVMSAPAQSIPAALPVSTAVSEYFARFQYTAFPVVDAGGRALGLLTAERLQSLSPSVALRTRVGELADRDPDLLVTEETDVASVLERPAFARVGRAIVVAPGGVPAGVLSVTDIQRALRSARLGARAGGRPDQGRPIAPRGRVRVG